MHPRTILTDVRRILSSPVFSQPCNPTLLKILTAAFLYSRISILTSEYIQLLPSVQHFRKLQYDWIQADRGNPSCLRNSALAGYHSLGAEGERNT